MFQRRRISGAAYVVREVEWEVEECSGDEGTFGQGVRENRNGRLS